MAKSKYQFDKRQKEIAREKKQELKRQQKLEKKRGLTPDEETWEADPAGPTAEDDSEAEAPEAETTPEAD